MGRDGKLADPWLTVTPILFADYEITLVELDGTIDHEVELFISDR